MKIIVVIAALLCRLSFASSLMYLHDITHQQGAQAENLHRQIKAQSKKLNFLNCPLELIEHQWNGPESLYKGFVFLQEFLNEAEQVDPDYDSIHDECLDTLDQYYYDERRGLKQRRALYTEEIKEVKANLLSKERSPKNQLRQITYNTNSLIDLIVDTINQESLCYTKRLALSASLLIGVGVGSYSMECYSPLGRRFNLKGPFMGFNLGVGVSLAMPNKQKFHDPLAYRFFLFERSIRDPWYTVTTSASIVPFVGFNSERGRHMVYKRDMRPSVGYHAAWQRNYQFMSFTRYKPYYLKLIMTGLFDNMADTAYQNNF